MVGAVLLGQDAALGNKAVVRIDLHRFELSFLFYLLSVFVFFLLTLFILYRILKLQLLAFRIDKEDPFRLFHHCLSFLETAGFGESAEKSVSQGIVVAVFSLFLDGNSVLRIVADVFGIFIGKYTLRHFIFIHQNGFSVLT